MWEKKSFLEHGLTHFLRLHLNLLHLLPGLVLLLVQVLEELVLPLDLAADVADPLLHVGLGLR